MHYTQQQIMLQNLERIEEKLDKLLAKVTKLENSVRESKQSTPKVSTQPTVDYLLGLGFTNRCITCNNTGWVTDGWQQLPCPDFNCPIKTPYHSE